MSGERGNRVLLIGGCGYLGSALFDHLFHRGWHIDTIDLEWFGNGVNRRNVRRDYAHLVHDELADYGSIVLLAGHASQAMCEGARYAAFDNNVASFVALLDELSQEQRFVYMSGASVYGATRGREATEADSLAPPATTFDLMQVEVERHAQLSDLDAYGLRLGDVSGYARHLRGDLPLNAMVAAHRTTGVIPVAAPETYRPVLGARDFARAVERVLLAPGRLQGVYNLASFNATAGELAERASAVLRADLVVGARSRAECDQSVSSALFSERFDFDFEDTVESIVRSLDDGWSRARVTTRKEPRPHA